MAAAGTPPRTDSVANARARVAALHAELDALDTQKALLHRSQSVAGNAEQTIFYLRLATTMRASTVCEVGFNVGHSAALWLSASARTTVISFDIWSSEKRAVQIRALRLLQARFPGRLHVITGPSEVSIPRSPHRSQCDLVSIDGAHKYKNVLRDVLNMRTLSKPDALYLLDDICHPDRCNSTRISVVGGPTLAMCDLISAGALELMCAAFEGERQFALLRQPPTSRLPERLPSRARPSSHARASLAWVHQTRQGANASGAAALPAHSKREELLPCAAACDLSVASPHGERKWRMFGEKLHRGWQDASRPIGCRRARAQVFTQGVAPRCGMFVAS